MPGDVSIGLNKFFFVAQLAGLTTSVPGMRCFRLLELLRIAWLGESPIDWMGLDRQRTTMPRLHDHRKTRGADQSRAVPQLRRLDFR